MHIGIPHKNGWNKGVQVFLALVLMLSGVITWSDRVQAAPEAASIYPKSSVITEVNFDWSTRQSMATGSDNWPITWADDDHQYTTWGDGGGFGGTNQNGRVSMGFARVEGSATSYQGYNVWGGVNSVTTADFTGKSYGILAVGGRLYSWRCGDGSTTTAYRFQRLYESTDRARTWNYTGVEYTQSYFGENRGFYCPTFLQFGKDYAGARDEYVYIYAPEIKSTAWDVQKPGEITLIRVPKASLKDRSQYQFFSGLDGSGNPAWVSNATQRKPVFADATNGVMLASAIYNAGLGRYLLTVEHTSSFKGNIGIYDAPTPWGPWTTVLFQSGWGAPNIDASTFFWNFSNKWTSADGKDFTLVYTGIGSNDTWNTVRGRFTVSGSNPPSPSPTPPPPAPPPGNTAFSARVNFQPSGATPAGYSIDQGSAFGDRGNGYTYGWNQDNQANTRDRNSSLSANDLYDTLNHMQYNGAFVWEIAVPNGQYQVRIVAGDALYFDSTYKINAEGTLVVNGSPTSENRWVEGTATVTVADGRLTVASGAGAVNNKINFIEIASVGTSAQPNYPEKLFVPGVTR